MKCRLLLLCAVLSLLLCACGKAETETLRTVTANGTQYVIDTAAGTVSDGKYTYRYSWEARASGGFSFHLTYPDGNKWWWTQENNSGYGGFSDGYESRNPEYPDGFMLKNMLVDGEMISRKDVSGPNPLIAVLLLAVGAWGTVSPESLWYVEHGWRYRNAEPSDLALSVNRCTGIVCLAVGILMLLLRIF